MSELGAGIALNEDWDFEIDASGDLKTVFAEDELQKDVAFNVARNMQDIIGQRIDDATHKRVQIAVNSVLVNESRIDEVQSVDVNRIGHRNMFEIVASAVATSGPVELVFTVEL